MTPRSLALAVALALSAAVLAACGPPPPPPPMGPPIGVFPNDTLTVADANQLTGKRVNLPMPSDCVANKSECDELTLINQLDGFDLDPTITLSFAFAVNPSKVTDSNLYVQPVAGGTAIGLNRLVYDSSNTILYGHPKKQLAPHTTYKVVVVTTLNGQAGNATFTTMSATTQLTKMVTQLDSGAAYTAAGIADRKLHVDAETGNSSPASYVASTLVPAAGITRTEDIGSGNTQSEQVFDSSTIATGTGAGTYTFGSFDAPEWLDATTRTIPTTPTGGAAPSAVRKETIGFVLATPNTSSCTQPAGGWPVAVFGPGVTRSKYDVLLASDEMLRNCFATIAIDPVGHAYGPASYITISFAAPPGQVQVTSHGRGVDVNGDGVIGDREGVQTKGQPDPNASIGLRDGLRQTALDNMALVRALEQDYGSGAGFSAPATGAGTLSRTNIKYFAQSLGGIYGTMVMATDPQLLVGAMSVPGGPILEIARLSPGFRGEVGVELHDRVPSAYDCGGQPVSEANCKGFQEQTPLYLDAPVANPTASARNIQAIGARNNWIQRSGSPEAFAPLLVANGKRVMYQFAYGDQTIPNPTSATLVRAAGLQSRTTLYRHDKDQGADQTCNPHGFLLDPRISVLGRTFAQSQFAHFFLNNGAFFGDPDGAGAVFEAPIKTFNTLETVNFANPPPTPNPECG